MTFFEKLLIVIISMSLSVLANLLYRLLDEYRHKKALFEELKILAENIESAIINNDASLCRPSIENLMANYVIFCKDKVMQESFRQILGFYSFLINGGYAIHPPSRKGRDLHTVSRIRGRLGVYKPSVIPSLSKFRKEIENFRSLFL